jgi:hypothetical protein
MDPRTCLVAARAAVKASDYEMASEYLQDYADWRRLGGFEPSFITVAGDELAYALNHACLLHGFEVSR